MADLKKQLMFVLGMHRSGTSAITGVLTRLGAPLPATPMTAVQENAKGFFESLAVMHVNDSILEEGGSSWDDWRQFSLPPEDARRIEDSIVKIIETEFGGAGFIALKDPRICRLFPLWRDAATAAGYVPSVVIPYRHPLEVAESLHIRNGLSIAEGLLLWLRHVLEAEFDSRGTQRVFITMTELLEDWRSCIDKISRQLKVQWPVAISEAATEIDAFLEGGMRHCRHSSDSFETHPLLVGWTAATYAGLEALRNADTKANRMALDKVRQELNNASRLVAPVLSGAIRRGQEQAVAQAGQGGTGMEPAVAELRDQLAASEARLMTEREMFAKACENHRTVSAAVTDLRERLAAAELRLTVERELFARERDQYKASNTEMAGLKEQIAMAEARLMAEREIIDAERNEHRALSATLAEFRERAAAIEARLTSEREIFAAERNEYKALTVATAELREQAVVRLTAERDVMAAKMEATEKRLAVALEAEAQRAIELNGIITALADIRFETDAARHRLEAQIESLQVQLSLAMQQLSEEREDSHSRLNDREHRLRQYREAGSTEFLAWAVRRDARP